MEKETKDLYVFGYGMALLIPYLIFFHSLSLGFNPVSVLILLCGFAFVLWVTTKISELNPWVNGWVLAVEALAAIRMVQTHPSLLPGIFLCLAIVILLTTIIRVERLAPVYKTWMKIGHAISQVLTMLILGAMYYFVFTPMAIFFRITKKDYLTRTIDPNVSSYWIKRENKEFKPEQYTKQF